MPIDFIRQTLGLDLESQAENYRNRLKEDRSGIKKWGAGDMFNDMFAEGTREEVEAAAKNLVEKEINKGATSDIELIKQGLSGVPGVNVDDLKIKDNETETQFDSRISGLKGTASAVIEAEGSTPGFDRTKLGENPTISSVSQLKRSTTDGLEDDPTRYGSRAYMAQQTANTEARLDRQERESQRRFDLQQDYQRFTAEQNAADRRANRDLQRQQNQQTLQLAIMDRADKKEDRRIAREDRQADKRQASIMMLIKGLTQLGAGFSI